jgi:hypothetical protein
MPNSVGFSKPTPFFPIMSVLLKPTLLKQEDVSVLLKPTLLKKEEVSVTVEPTPL